MDRASYEEIRKTVDELSATTGMYCACFDSIGRCFIHAAAGQHSVQVSNMRELPFFRDFQTFIRKNEKNRCYCLRYQGLSGRECLIVPLFPGGQYWGGVLLMESGQAEEVFPKIGRNAFFAFAAKILVVYAAAIQESVQAYRERLDLLQCLADWYPRENWIDERRAMFLRLWRRMTSYQMDPVFLWDFINAIHSLAVLEQNRAMEEQYFRLANLQRMYLQKNGQTSTLQEEEKLCALARECIFPFIEQKIRVELLFDREAGACVIPAFFLFRISQSAVHELLLRDGEWKLTVETRRNGEEAEAAIRCVQIGRGISEAGWSAFDLLFNHGGESIKNLPEPGCLKAVRDLKAYFRDKLSTSFTVLEEGGFSIQITFPYREG